MTGRPCAGNEMNGERYEKYTTGKASAYSYAEAGCAGVQCVRAGSHSDHCHYHDAAQARQEPCGPGEQPSSEVLVPGEEDISDHYQISETSAALLPETADAGESYQKETLFLGDSNTVRLYANGLISLQQFCAKEGIGTHAALNEGIVTFKKDSSTYTIAQAVAKMKPRRVVIMLGTNDTGMSVDEFIKNYTALVQAIQESYPYTDIIVNTVPPVPQTTQTTPTWTRPRSTTSTWPCCPCVSRWA